MGDQVHHKSIHQIRFSQIADKGHLGVAEAITG
jgi:hypothetical protein